jgi:hypothetical protein
MEVLGLSRKLFNFISLARRPRGTKGLDYEQQEYEVQDGNYAQQ